MTRKQCCPCDLDKLEKMKPKQKPKLTNITVNAKLLYQTQQPWQM